MVKKVAIAAAVIVVLGAYAWWAIGAETQAPAPPALAARWEYKTVTTTDDGELNRLGEDGWELAAAVPDVTGGSMRNGSSNGIHTNVRLIFKRHKTGVGRQ